MVFDNPLTGRPIHPRLTVPQAFGDAMSYTDMILTLAHLFNDLSASVDDEHAGLQTGIDTVSQSVQDLAKVLAASVAVLNRRIDELSAGMQVYDVFTGAYEPNQDAMRETARWLAIEGLTIGELNSLIGLDSVTALKDCGLNCVGLAVVGRWLLEKFELPERYEPTGRVAGQALTSKDYPRLMVDDDNHVYKAW